MDLGTVALVGWYIYRALYVLIATTYFMLTVDLFEDIYASFVEKHWIN